MLVSWRDALTGLQAIKAFQLLLDEVALVPDIGDMSTVTLPSGKKCFLDCLQVSEDKIYLFFNYSCLRIQDTTSVVSIDISLIF